MATGDEKWLSILLGLKEQALSAEPESDAAAEAVARFLFYAVNQVRPVIERRAARHEKARDRWRDVLGLVERSCAVGELDDLSRALADLENGIVDPGLSPALKRGRRGPSWRELVAMRVIVEGADALNAELQNDLVYRLDLQALGVPYSTVEDHRRKLERAGGRWAAQRSFLLVYGEAKPADVARRGARLLSSVRKSLKAAE